MTTTIASAVVRPRPLPSFRARVAPAPARRDDRARGDVRARRHARRASLGSRQPHYDGERAPVLAVRIQEMFGLPETPRVARGKVPVLLHLLAPNGRPQQVTDDLASFWKDAYHHVRKDLRTRYPKHDWPEDALSARPSSRPRRRRRR